MSWYQCYAIWSNGGVTTASGTSREDALSNLDVAIRNDNVNNNGISLIDETKCLDFGGDSAAAACPTSGEWYARFYEHGDLTGHCVEIKGIGRENGIPDLGTWNNEFSSALVKPGYRVRAFQNLNYSGEELRLDKDPQYGRANFISGSDGIMQFTYFPSDFNDKISSMYCELDF
jgi:hypothetical protein